MGITQLSVRVINPADRTRVARVKCLVDSGAVFAIIPAPILDRIGVEVDRRDDFTLADGSQITRQLGDAIFAIGSRRGASPVIFGEPGDATVIGAVTLENLGLVLDPFKRELRPLPMLLV